MEEHAEIGIDHLTVVPRGAEESDDDSDGEESTDTDTYAEVVHTD